MSVRFLADMGIAASVVEQLRRAGYDAVHVRDRMAITSDDGEILDLATREARVVLTMDHDFGNLVVARHVAAPPIVFFRVNDERPAAIWRRLEVILQTVAEELAKGCIVVVEDTRLRVRTLPIHPRGIPS